MSDSKPSKPPADELAKELKAALAQRRPRPWKAVVAVLLLCTLALVGMWVWLLPKAHSGPLQVVAFDGLFTSEETPIARGQLFVPPDDETAPSLNGRTVAFDEPNLFAPVRKEPISASSDATGQAATAWPLANAEVGEFFVRYVDRERREGSVNERGRLFVWPKDAPILLVEADETLSDDADDQAATALSKAAKEGWRIVYLEQASVTAADFRKARGTLENQVKLPSGPILGRRRYPAEDTLDAARREVLQSIKSRFRGKLLAVVKTTDAAQACKDAGWSTILLGTAVAPAEVVRVPTWADVPLRLK